MNEIPEHLKHYFADTNELRAVVEEANRKMDLPLISTLTTNESRERILTLRQDMRESGISAEENIFTCLLYKMRDSEDKEA